MSSVIFNIRTWRVGKQNLSCDVSPPNISMFKMRIFGTGNKQYLKNMIPNPNLYQGIIRREIISRDIICHVLMF